MPLQAMIFDSLKSFEYLDQASATFRSKSFLVFTRSWMSIYFLERFINGSSNANSYPIARKGK